MIEFSLSQTETSFDVSEALPISKLSKSHAEKLVPARTSSLNLSVTLCITLEKKVAIMYGSFAAGTARRNFLTRGHDFGSIKTGRSVTTQHAVCRIRRI